MRRFDRCVCNKFRYKLARDMSVLLFKYISPPTPVFNIKLIIMSNCGASYILVKISVGFSPEIFLVWFKLVVFETLVNLKIIQIINNFYVLFGCCNQSIILYEAQRANKYNIMFDILLELIILLN